MSPSVVLSAGKLRNSSAKVHLAALIGTAINSRGKCMPLSAPPVAKTPKCLSSHGAGDLYTAATATLKSGVKAHLRGIAK